MTTPWSADWTSSAVVADRASTGDAALAVVVDKPLVDKPLVDEHVVDEHRVRACAGMTMVLGAVAFSYAYFRQVYWPLQVVSALFALDFLIRVTAGLRYSPVGVLAGLLTRRHRPEWVSAAPKRFAWTLGLAMSGAMAVITNSGIRGWLPRTICLICGHGACDVQPPEPGGDGR